MGYECPNFPSYRRDNPSIRKECRLPFTISRKPCSKRMASMLAQPRRFCHPLFVGCFSFGMAVVLSTLPAKSDPFASPWSGAATEKAHMRLVATVGSDGAYVAAAGIKLAPNAVTYWREPGDAGVPPKFSFEGSENVASAEVLFPAPNRIDEQGIEAFGYRGGVVFPIRVQAGDAAKPVHLVLTADYAVCENICLPEKSRAELVLPLTGDGTETAAIATAEAHVPVDLPSKDVAQDVSIVSDPAAASPTWAVMWRG